MSINNSSTMFYGASSSVFEKAKDLRKNMSASESTLWEVIRGKNILGMRFRQQHPINKYISDFYCHPIRLVVEVDGGIIGVKEQKDYDIGREGNLNEFGIKVIRFSNNDIENNLGRVLNEMSEVSQNRKAEFKVPKRGFRGALKSGRCLEV